MEVAKQIAYWRQGAEEAWDSACYLIEGNRIGLGLFAAHLALEKALKAHVSRETQVVPPKIHNLVRLSELANLSVTDEQYNVLSDMNEYHLEGRYADMSYQTPTRVSADLLMSRVKEVVQWLIQQLPQA